MKNRGMKVGILEYGSRYKSEEHITYIGHAEYKQALYLLNKSLDSLYLFNKYKVQG